MTPFFTGKGDSGTTGFLGKGRLSKDSVRIEAVGSVDEATAALGLARGMTEIEEVRKIIITVQKKLYELMSELSADAETAEQFDKIDESDVEWLEKQIVWFENSIDMPREFIIPGESPASGALAVARTIVRRAERRVIALLNAGGITKEVLLAYLNRLSSLIFILEVYESSISGRKVRLVKED
jgi:cob(I)alamin adenosyltransferase